MYTGVFLALGALSFGNVLSALFRLDLAVDWLSKNYGDNLSSVNWSLPEMFKSSDTVTRAKEMLGTREYPPPLSASSTLASDVGKIAAPPPSDKDQAAHAHLHDEATLQREIRNAQVKVRTRCETLGKLCLTHVFPFVQIVL